MSRQQHDLSYLHTRKAVKANSPATDSSLRKDSLSVILITLRNYPCVDTLCNFAKAAAAVALLLGRKAMYKMFRDAADIHNLLPYHTTTKR